MDEKLGVICQILCWPPLSHLISPATTLHSGLSSTIHLELIEFVLLSLPLHVCNTNSNSLWLLLHEDVDGNTVVVQWVEEKAMPGKSCIMPPKVLDMRLFEFRE